VPETVFEIAVRRFAGRLQNLSVDIVKPAMVATTQAAVFDMTEFKRRAAVGAAQSKQAEAAFIVAKDHEILAEQPATNGTAFELGAKADGMPVAAHHFAAWRSRADACDQFIFFDAERHNLSPEFSVSCPQEWATFSTPTRPKISPFTLFSKGRPEFIEESGWSSETKPPPLKKGDRGGFALVERLEIPPDLPLPKGGALGNTQ
jgi:hypothetical protein